MENKELKYNLQPMNFNVEELDKLEFPSLKDRVIEKRGHLITFTLNQIEDNTRELLKTKKELTAKRQYEAAVMENIEHFHKFVKKLTPEQLLTVWMYKNSLGHVELCDANLAKIDKQLKEDEEEVAEIMKQIPELKEIKSADIIDEEVVLVESEKE